MRILNLTQEGYNDYPVITKDNSQNIWVCWLNYLQGKEKIQARYFNGTCWSSLIRVSPEHRMVLKPSLGVDKLNQRIWIAWPAYSKGRWRIFLRSYNSRGKGGPLLELPTPSPKNFSPSLSCDGKGNLWIAWVSFLYNDYHICLQKYNGHKWLKMKIISQGTHSNSNPIIAHDWEDNLWIVWDALSRGEHFSKAEYNIYIRKLWKGRLSPLTQLTKGKKLNTSPFLLVDNENKKIWLTWNNNWINCQGYGYDNYGNERLLSLEKKIVLGGYGYRTKRNLCLACWDKGKWHFLSEEEKFKNIFREKEPIYPTLLVDKEGKLWLFYLIYNTPLDNPTKGNLHWDIYGRWFFQGKWSPAMKIGNWKGGHTDRVGATYALGKIWVVWQRDKRSYSIEARCRGETRKNNKSDIALVSFSPPKFKEGKP